MKKQKLMDNIICFCAVAFFVLFFGFAIIATAEPVDAAEAKTETITAKVTLYEDIPLDLDLIEHIQGLCCDYNIPVELALAVIEQESTYKADAVSPIGAKGLMQVQPKYHQDRMKELKCTDLLDPYQNVMVGMDYLGELLEKYSGNEHEALTAYNHGEKGANDKYFSKGVYESDYSREVLEKAEIIKEGMIEMSVTDDPHKDFDNWDNEQHAKLKERPICSECDHHIQDEKCYEFGGKLICPVCLKDYHEKDTEDYVG